MGSMVMHSGLYTMDWASAVATAVMTEITGNELQEFACLIIGKTCSLQDVNIWSFS